MEIPCNVSVKWISTDKNKMVILQYKQLIEVSHVEPEAEEVLGSWLNDRSTNVKSYQKQINPR